MIRIPLSCVAALALVGCQPADDGEPADGAETSASTRNETVIPVPSPTRRPATEEPSTNRITATADLAGEYRVAGVDGQGIDLPYGISASISGDRIHVTADCVNMDWSYRFENGAQATERVPVESCARGLTREEQAIAEAFDTATAVVLNRANGFEFTGDGSSVTLFTQ